MGLQVQGRYTHDTSVAAITKLLKVGHGTSVPDADFKFTVTSVSVDGDTDAKAPLADVGGPGVNGDISISFPAEGIPPLYTQKTTSNNIDYYYLESAELFGHVDWLNAGIYEYRIVENGSSYNAGAGETLTNSKAEYTVTVYVDYVSPRRLGITNIVVLMTRNDAGDTVGDLTKLDPTPGGDEVTYHTSQMIFTNEFWRTIGPTNPADGGHTLAVIKTVTGNYAATSIYSRYDMTITTPDLIGIDKEFKAFVIEENPSSGNWNIVTTADNYAGAIEGDGAIIFTPGASFTFHLRHNQRLVFEDLPVGTSYVIDQTGTSGYTPKVTVSYNASTNIQDLTTGTSGGNYSLPNSAIAANNLFVSEDGSSAAFANDRGNVAPTGFNLNNLPFYGLILLAVGGIIAFFVVKSRKKRDETTVYNPSI